METSAYAEEPDNGGALRFLRGLLVFLLNVVGFVVLCFLTLWAFNLLAKAEYVSNLENNAASWSTVFFYGALFGGLILSFTLTGGVHELYNHATKKRFPAWGINTFFAIWAFVGWLAAWSLYAIPVTHTVGQGEVRITADGTFLTEGYTVAGNRREPTSLRQSLAWSGTYGARVPMSDTDWVSTTITLGWTVAVTPELQEAVRQSPPVLTDENAKHYFAYRIIGLLKPEMGRLIRAEAMPGQAAVGEAGAWIGRSQASVPMDVRLGLQLEDNGAIRPSWLRQLSIENVSVSNWHRQERAS